jgi:hypothetical protein
MAKWWHIYMSGIMCKKMYKPVATSKTSNIFCIVILYYETVNQHSAFNNMGSM